VINESTYIPGGCPITDVKLFVDPPRPKRNADITISFRPGFHLNPNDNITVVMATTLGLISSLLCFYFHMIKTHTSIRLWVASRLDLPLVDRVRAMRWVN
jgi:uncharacterized protein (DUF2344 family)